VADVGLREISKSFGATATLQRLSTHVADGSFTVVVGPSGCGKSTLLRLVAGLDQPDGGAITIAGEDVTRQEPGRRGVAMVFQSYALYPHMTVAENIGFGLSVRGTPRAEIARRTARVAEVLQIGDLLGRKPRQLSGGQRQRVAMGRAMVREPRVFLFDEPLSNLDARLRISMRTELRRLHREIGATSLYVTHDQVEAMTLGDRLIVMHAGRVEQEGAALEIYERPASLFVANFIGAPPMNLLPAHPVEGGVAIEGVASFPTTAKLPARMVAGLRPEHLLPAAPEAATLTLRVELVEPQGAETIVHGFAGPHRLTVRLDGVARLVAGEALPLRVAPGALHLFDEATTLRVPA